MEDINKDCLLQQAHSYIQHISILNLVSMDDLLGYSHLRIPSIGLELKLLSRIPMQTAATTTSDALLLQKL